MNNIASPQLISVLDSFISDVRRSAIDIGLDDAFVDAIDTWIATMAAEHNHSQPFAHHTTDDPFGQALTQLVAAVEHLTVTYRPHLTVTTALQEALHDWNHTP